MDGNNIVVIEFKPNVGHFKIPSRCGHSRWDGYIISEKKQCRVCAFRREVELRPYTKQADLFEESVVENHRDKIVGVCTQGWAWKILYKSEKKRKCQYVGEQGRNEPIGVL